MNPYTKLFTTKEFDGGRKAISVLNKSNGAAVDDILLQIIRGIELEGADTDTAYQIMDRAASILEDEYNRRLKTGEDVVLVPNAIVDLENIDAFGLSQDASSVFTGERLSYLTPSNQDDITEIVKSHDVDIATAAAIWYEDRVAQAIEHLASMHDELMAARTCLYCDKCALTITNSKCNECNQNK